MYQLYRKMSGKLKRIAVSPVHHIEILACSNLVAQEDFGIGINDLKDV